MYGRRSYSDSGYARSCQAAVTGTRELLASWHYALPGAGSALRADRLHAGGIQGLAARRNYLAPFSTNPSHVDAQAVTITLMKRSSFWPGLALQRLIKGLTRRHLGRWRWRK